MASFIGQLRSIHLDKNHFFYFCPSKRDCSKLKGVWQRRGNHPKGQGFFIGVAMVSARPFQPETILFRWMKIETTQLLFVQSMLNRSSDLSGRIKLAKFRLFIYSKLEFIEVYISVKSPGSEN